jgi:AcrR family transcriptional regulator
MARTDGSTATSPAGEPASDEPSSSTGSSTGSSTAGAASLRERNRLAAMADVQAVAVRMMRAAGFGNVTVEQIAEAAGVSPSTMYRYFGTKEALVLWGDRPAQLVRTLAGAATDDDTSAGERFAVAATTTYTAHERELLSQLRLVFDDEDLAIAFEHQLLSRRHDVAAVFAEMRTAKSVGARDDVAAGACLGALISVLDRWQRSDGQKSLTKMIVRIGTATAG